MTKKTPYQKLIKAVDDLFNNHYNRHTGIMYANYKDKSIINLDQALADAKKENNLK